MLALRSRVKEDLEFTSNKIVFGNPLRLPEEFFESFQTNKSVTTVFIAKQQNFFLILYTKNHYFRILVVPFLKIASIMYIYNLLKNLFDFALVRLK